MAVRQREHDDLFHRGASRRSYRCARPPPSRVASSARRGGGYPLGVCLSREHLELEDAMSTATYNVPAISCNHCKHAIEGQVKNVAGVKAVEVDVQAKTVRVEADPLDAQAIILAIDEAGYEVAA